MLFTGDAAKDLASGKVTITFRTWSRPQAKAGGHYRTCGLLLEVDSISLVALDSVGDFDARRAGFLDAGALRTKFHGQGHDGEVWRVEFRCLGPDDRIARRNDASLDASKLAKIETRLERFDKASKTGAWTRQTLRLIEGRPGVVSTVLARLMRLDRAAFKLNVRKLKELGLTESLEVGYRLSPLGAAVLKVWGERD